MWRRTTRPEPIALLLTANVVSAKKLGHWSQACLTTKYSQAKYSSQQHQSKRQQPQPRQRAVHETQENLTAEFEELTFHAIETSSDGTQAHAKIRIEAYPGRSTNLHGKIDTGSQGNILPLHTYSQIYPQRIRNGKPIQYDSIRNCAHCLQWHSNQTTWIHNSTMHVQKQNVKVQILHRRHKVISNFWS